MVSDVQLIRDLYDALGRGDMPVVLGAMDPGIEWREAEGNPYEPSGKAWLGTFSIHRESARSALPAILHAAASRTPTR
jgi:ketosteroid isomerase-like protein